MRGKATWEAKQRAQPMQRPWGRTGPRVLKGWQGGPRGWSKGRHESRVEGGQFGQGLWATWRKVGFIKGSGEPWRP